MNPIPQGALGALSNAYSNVINANLQGGAALQQAAFEAARLLDYLPAKKREKELEAQIKLDQERANKAAEIQQQLLEKQAANYDKELESNMQLKQAQLQAAQASTTHAQAQTKALQQQAERENRDYQQLIRMGAPLVRKKLTPTTKTAKAQGIQGASINSSKIS